MFAKTARIMKFRIVVRAVELPFHRIFVAARWAKLMGVYLSFTKEVRETQASYRRSRFSSSTPAPCW
jgi:hypothetical protein